jgi:hypothetical protein
MWTDGAADGDYDEMYAARPRIKSKESVVRIREIAEDVGWLIVIFMLLPLAIPLAVLAFMFLLGQRLYAGHRERRRLGHVW